jgi:HesB-like selenoprotein
MENIKISEEAYEEFKGFLDYNKLPNYDLRISYMGRNCSGLIFNIDNGVKEDNDIVEKVKDINFIMDEELIKEYGGFIILSNNENEGRGLELRSVIEPKSPCTVCPGC